MKIINCIDYEDLSQKACDLLYHSIEKNPVSTLCLATGRSPLGLYQLLASQDLSAYEKVEILQLDEWVGLTGEDEGSCQNFLIKHVVRPWNIDDDRYHSFDGMAADLSEEAQRMEHLLSDRAPIDICVLGLGVNGHIGFNEPAEFLLPYCHIATLSETSLSHAMIQNNDLPLSTGLTLGMSHIMNAKKVILLITGVNKKKIVQKWLTGQITSSLPASFLWMHPDVSVFMDQTCL